MKSPRFPPKKRSENPPRMVPPGAAEGVERREAGSRPSGRAASSKPSPGILGPLGHGKSVFFNDGTGKNKQNWDLYLWFLCIYQYIIVYIYWWVSLGVVHIFFHHANLLTANLVGFMEIWRCLTNLWRFFEVPRPSASGVRAGSAELPCRSPSVPGPALWRRMDRISSGSGPLVEVQLL